MKTLTKSIVAVSLCLVASVPVYAGHGRDSDRLSDRIERQQSRIEYGIQSNQLTRKEAKILKQQQRRIRELARYYREDGRLSKRERQILNNKLDRASWKIRELKHNELTRHVKKHHHEERCCDHVNYGKKHRRDTDKHRF